MSRFTKEVLFLFRGVGHGARHPTATRKLSNAITPNSTSSSTVASIVTAALTKSQGNAGAVKISEPKMKFKDRFRLFWKSLYTDYNDVLWETVADAKAKPRKAAVYLSILGGVSFMASTNPLSRTYMEEVTKFDTELSITSKEIRNPTGEKYFLNLRKLEMKGLLRFQSLGVCTLVWRDNEASETGVYYSSCKYTKPRLSEIVSERVIDIGFVGRWWLLHRNMEDFDVNFLEWGENSDTTFWTLFNTATFGIADRLREKRSIVDAKIIFHFLDNLLRISWHDSAWIPILNAANVLDYFSERSNPFYDRTCNNEIVKMQRLSSEQLTNMTGLEYILLHVQEPILYVIRKQHRHTTQQVTPIADYYIIAGVVYQAPDLGSVVNSRLLNTVHHLQAAFDECISYTRYHPSKGYSWEFKEKQDQEEKPIKKEKKEEPSSVFQRQRVDMLLLELSKKFPPKLLQIEGPSQPKPQQPSSDSSKTNEPSQNQDVKPDVQIKQEKDVPQVNQQQMKPPPEKRQKLA